MDVPENPVDPEVVSERSHESLVEDLAAILSEGFQIYAVLGPTESCIAVKGSPEAVAYGNSISARSWAKMTERERAESVISWIREAAKYYRAPKIRYAPKREEAA